MENNRKVLIGRKTLGLALILFGITLVVQTIFTMDILRFILMLWPIIIIAIGVEIIYYSNKENVTAKYDFLGIILTGLIVVSGIGFSILSYGVNKILYSDDAKEYIAMQQEQDTDIYFGSKINIINLDDKPIKYKIIESSAYEKSSKVIVHYTIKYSYKCNIFDLLSGTSNTNITRYLNASEVDGVFATLEIEPLPDLYDSVEFIITTTSKDLVSFQGKFQNI